MSLLKNNKPTTHPLSDQTIDRILIEHQQRIGPQSVPQGSILVGGPLGYTKPIPRVPWQMAYDPDTGRYLGLPGTRVDPPDINRLVLIDDNHLPTRERLAEIRVDEDGFVIGGHCRMPPPPPPEVPGPSDDPGVPLSDRAINAIVRNHAGLMSSGAGMSGPAGWNPTIPYAFRVSDGQYVGCPWELEVAKHEHEMVCLTNQEIIDAQHLRRVRVHENGWVTWLPEAPE